MAAGLQQAFCADAMGKPLHAGHAAEAGALAAILAEKGMTGAPGMLEGGLGFGNAMSCDVDWDAVSDSLANEFTITAMTQKNHTCCGHTFAAIDAVLALKAEHRLTPSDIAGISVATYRKAVELCSNADPRTVYEAKFSLPFAVAVALVTGAARFDSFRDERLRNPEIRNLMARVTTIVDADAEAAFPGRRSATMRIETTDGRLFQHCAPTRKGDPDNPLSDDELVYKYRELVTPVINKIPAEALLVELWKIDEIIDLTRLPYHGVQGRRELG
jgi:2-methylcitrate dehydratase PrpD